MVGGRGAYGGDGMSRDDRRHWDERYRFDAPATAPNATLQALLPRLPPAGRALDVACGTGANAALLAAHGFRVDAVDISREGLLRARARGGLPALRVVQMDLDAPALRDVDAWDLVVCTSFLDRKLLDRLPGWVRPGGHLFFETFHRGHLAGRPHFRPEWLLERGEIETLFPGLRPVTRGETDVRAFVLARKST